MMTLSRFPEGRTYIRRRARLWEIAAKFLRISKFIRDRAITRGFPEEKPQLHYTGTDLELLRPGSAQRDPHIILFVGRPVEKKGCMHLLSALSIVRKENPLAHLVMIGDGPLREALRFKVQSENLPCTFLGGLPAHAVRQHMVRAQIFCAPSVEAANGDSEGLGMVFVEAQAVETPVVSFDHGGIKEAVLNSKTGLFSPEGDSRALADDLLMLLGDRRLGLSLSTRAIKNVSERFDLRKQTSQLENIYS